MVPSENLRNELAHYYNLPLSNYAWSKELRQKIFDIKLDSDIEDRYNFLGEVYNFGLNIGHCGTTSRYFSREFPKAKLHYGICDILVGTKRSNFGGHAWVEMDNFLIDPSLMIYLPISLKEEFGYHTERIIDKECSTILSEYDTYSNEFIKMRDNPSEYVESLYNFGNNEQR